MPSVNSLPLSYQQRNSFSTLPQDSGRSRQPNRVTTDTGSADLMKNKGIIDSGGGGND